MSTTNGVDVPAAAPVSHVAGAGEGAGEKPGGTAAERWLLVVIMLLMVLLPTLESIAHVRLLTGISSADATTDTKVEGVLSQPVFAANSELLLPEGTRLTGHVRHAQAARWFHRGGVIGEPGYFQSQLGNRSAIDSFGAFTGDL